MSSFELEAALKSDLEALLLLRRWVLVKNGSGAMFWIELVEEPLKVELISLFIEGELA